MFKLLHKHKSHKHEFKTTQREYLIIYTGKWINYNISYCSCGKYSLMKNCGNLEVEDIPENIIKKAIKRMK